jgi:hypothetical protein
VAGADVTLLFYLNKLKYTLIVHTFLFIYKLLVTDNLLETMKVLITLSILVIFVTLSASQNNNVTSAPATPAAVECAAGRWGPSCANVCGNCADGGCKADGNCDGGCKKGWKGEQCAEAECSQDCGPGICVAPNTCGACGDINLVGPNCEDIRLRGLLGSLIALGVISISITLCGIGSVYYKRSRNTPVAL